MIKDKLTSYIPTYSYVTCPLYKTYMGIVIPTHALYDESDETYWITYHHVWESHGFFYGVLEWNMGRELKVFSEIWRDCKFLLFEILFLYKKKYVYCIINITRRVQELCICRYCRSFLIFFFSFTFRIPNIAE